MAIDHFPLVCLAMFNCTTSTAGFSLPQIILLSDTDPRTVWKKRIIKCDTSLTDDAIRYQTVDAAF